MIDIVNVTQYYGAKPVLHDINLRVETGELVTVMGPNGTGKSTLLKVVAGLLWPLKGHVAINGLRRRSSVDNEQAIRQKTVYLPTDPWFPKESTGREFLITVGRLWDIDDRRLVEHAASLIQLFNLDDVADTRIGSYSSGQQKKIALASALITETPVMILDEPFAGGLDPSGILALTRVMQRLAERRDATVLMATPVPELVEKFAHRIAVMHEGRIVACETPDGLRKLTDCTGPLQEVLERLINPRTLEKIDSYFAERHA
jgi:ABC-2 type transport system ATP-binding protein